MYSLYYLVVRVSSNVCAAIVQLYRTHYIYYLVLHVSSDFCEAYLYYFSALTQILHDLAAPTKLVPATPSCRPLPAACLPSRANGSAPVPPACPQPSICLHFPVPIGSTRPIKPAKPVPPKHSWTNTPSAVIQSRLFHQITCPSKPFYNRHAKRCDPVLSFLIRLPTPPIHFRTYTPIAVIQSHLFHNITCLSKPLFNLHAKRCEPVPSLIIRLPAPPSYFWTDAPSAVSQSHNSSSDSSFINYSSGIK